MPTKKIARATRPVFLPHFGTPRFLMKSVEFDWFPGFALSQQQKSIASFHAAIRDLRLASVPLEISTRSPEELGKTLSAFRLYVDYPSRGIVPLESAFQASKVFESELQYLDILSLEPRQAKRDPRLQSSRPMVGFRFVDQLFPLQPETAFYDWLYLQALSRVHATLLNELTERDAFTDISFNPQRSLNCQARSAAIFVSLRQDGHEQPWVFPFEDFVEIVSYSTSDK
ncbi:MAG: hypothetical protein QOH93_455 [Chloroflexia bacterium]|jgi:type I restriction enzyme M protein|nr:hypothetical protein [Chloroflexia bacterium]